MEYIKPANLDLSVNIVRHNRAASTSTLKFNGDVALYSIPNAGVYRLLSEEDMLYMYIMYNITYIIYTRCKLHFIENTLLDQNLATIVRSRLGIMHISLFDTKFNRVSNKDRILLALNDTNSAKDGDILGVLFENASTNIKVSLTEGMEEYIEKLQVSIFSSAVDGKYPETINEFYTTTLIKFPELCRVIRPSILVESVMFENLPEIYGRSMKEHLSTDYLTNLGLKTHLMMHINQIPRDSLKEQSKNLLDKTEELFGKDIYSKIGKKIYTQQELYKILAGNILFNTAIKNNRSAFIENMANYVDVDGVGMQEYQELIKHNRTTILFT